jgi:hypothetical protein
MALIIPTSNPQALLTAIYTAIDNQSVTTWEYLNKNGQRYLTHTSPQWNRKAWFQGAVYQGELRFGLVKAGDITVTTEVYAVYHGRFIEMLLAHFDGNFDRAAATSKPTTPDNF